MFRHQGREGQTDNERNRLRFQVLFVEVWGLCWDIHSVVVLLLFLKCLLPSDMQAFHCQLTINRLRGILKVTWGDLWWPVMFSLAELQPLLHRTWVPLWYLLLCLSECSVLWISRFLYIPGSHLDNSYLQREVYLGDVTMTGGHYWHLPSRAWDAGCSVVCGTVLHNEELSYSEC